MELYWRYAVLLRGVVTMYGEDSLPCESISVRALVCNTSAGDAFHQSCKSLQ